MTIRDDHALAADLATEAGERLLRIRERTGFDDPAALRAEGDRAAHVLLMESLSRLRPSDCVLSEEATREERLDPRRLTAERVWIVDPLDGTREFSERRAGPGGGSLRDHEGAVGSATTGTERRAGPGGGSLRDHEGAVGSATMDAQQGRSDWAVHVALWERGRLAAGAVALPAQGRTLTTADPPKPPAHVKGRFRIAVSRTRPPEFVQKLAYLVGADLVPIGSAGAKISAVLTGEVEAYVHAGGQYEWDSAAPVAVALAAGVHASRIDGSELIYNQADPSLPDILVSLPELAASLLAGIRDLHR
ncbi:inositol monophosphatase family protein [Nonomuraea diastatica]|uniref:3'(2'),5-bisphosphonucleoside 3'(2')-phosphohydrolase n=1 Tax=Nonomuraea diastatica TaxID=1848329 RepID=A0A4R4W295_9ACTN|nr:inositol monophosphatase family protein [Nonomuraea diastatica]TDD12679.1 3'(2'),5'-bisphosphate nucleotidase CysQ [Nonomuraea diastatica]